MTSVDAVVVHYRGGTDLDRCVGSCLAIQRVDSVIVVDNEGTGSSLRARHRDPRVRVVQMPANVGYGRAANVGLDLASADAVVVLNQDVVLTPGALDEMLAAASASGAWVLGPRLVDAAGVEARLKTGFPAPLRWPVAEGEGDGWRAAPWVAGAAMLLAPGNAELRFDRRIFMYGEDEELCYRVWREGGSVAIADRARVVHHGGTAAGMRWSRRQVAARTILNRGRFVRWHAGWRAVPRYALETLRRRVRARRP